MDMSDRVEVVVATGSVSTSHSFHNISMHNPNPNSIHPISHLRLHAFLF